MSKFRKKECRNIIAINGISFLASMLVSMLFLEDSTQSKLAGTILYSITGLGFLVAIIQQGYNNE